MALYNVSTSSLTELPVTSFSGNKIKEREHLQRLLRDHPEVLGNDLLIVDEEFSRWEDSKHRIDLLALSSDGSLIVIELKRDEDGGYMDLQAIRYAAMVSTMTLDQVIEAHKNYLQKLNRTEDAEEHLKEFLQTTDEGIFEINSAKPKIILASGDFSRELTTSVLWLNEVGLDIRCVRLRTYLLESQIILDAQQIIPLPEAEEYLVHLREKAARSADLHDRTEPWTREDVARLAAEVTNPTIICLFDLCADTPTETIPFSDLVLKSGRTRGQARGDLAGLTIWLKARFARRNWPVEFVWAAHGDNQNYYRMSSDVADWWKEARRSQASSPADDAPAPDPPPIA